MLRNLCSCLLFLLSGCQHFQAHREWRTAFYTVNGPELAIWEAPSAERCVLAAGPPDVVERLRKLAITGRAEFLVERLPAPKPNRQVAGELTSDQYVVIRGVRVQPQCQSKDLYWISDFHFLGAYEWNEDNVLIPRK